MSIGPNIFNDISRSNDQMLNAAQILNINPDVLLKLKKHTATSTARTILKHLFPSPPANFTLSDVDRTVADAIVCKSKFFNFYSLFVCCIVYSKQCHPNDESTNSKIRKAMSNHFSVIKFNKKIKTI